MRVNMSWSLLLLCVTSSLALYSPSDKIVELTEANFASKVLKDDRIWVVEFYAPYCGHCKNLAPEYKKAAKLLKGIAKVGALDATVHQQTPGKYAVQGYPTIKIFSSDDKKTPIDYKGPRTAKGIADAVTKEIKKTLENRTNGGKSNKSKSNKKDDDNKKTGDVIVLTDSNFEKLVLNSKDAWMVEFFAPWCGHCQRLEPEWKKAANWMGGKVKFGALDATAHESMARKFQIQGFPTIKFFPPGASESNAEDYQGGRTSSDLINFAESKYASVGPPPEVIEATGKEVTMNACKNKQLCIFTFFPSIYDCQSKCRKEKINMLQDLASQFKTRKWGWVWMEAGAQKDIEKAFGVGESGYPVLTALSPSKMKFTTQVGQFSKAGIKEFLNSVNYGKGRVQKVEPAWLWEGFLKVAETQNWDGKDKEIPVMEDIDLSDVFLDEKVEL